MADYLHFINYFNYCDRGTARTVLPRSNLYDDYGDAKFRERFRLSKGTVAKLLEEVSVTP